ncbi:hypothetical protein APV28_3990 [Comamonas testosteroni]|nr:hypothetical protein APV28_3990 [Comamonas testosteroni]
MKKGAPGAPFLWVSASLESEITVCQAQAAPFLMANALSLARRI